MEFKKSLRNYTKSSGGRGVDNKNCININGGGSASSDDWDYPFEWRIYNALGAGSGFHFFACINPDQKYWFNEKVTYKLQVSYLSDCNITTNADGSQTITNTTGKYIVDISKELDVLGSAIGHTIKANSNTQIYYYFEVSNSKAGWYIDSIHDIQQYVSPYNINYSDGQVTFNCDSNSYITACEFKTSTTPYPYSTYSDTARQLFYEAACQQTEYSYEHKFYNKKFKRWNKTQVTVGVNFMSSVSADIQGAFKGYVQQAINIVNNTTAGSGFSLKMIDGITGGNYNDAINRNGNGDIQLWWGNYEELFGISVPSDYRYFGTWENNAASTGTYITEATVRLCTEKVWMMNYQGITYEEIVEALGAGNDVRYTAESVYSDFWFTNKNLNSSSVLDPYTNDLYVLEMLYNYDLPSNVDNWVIAKMINAPNGAKSVITSFSSGGAIDLTFLDSNTTYEIRLISAYYETTSTYSEYKTITTPSRPDYFSWDTQKVQGQSFKLTAAEWNSLTRNINMIRTYKNYHTYSFTMVYAGDTITAAIYNEARKAIQGISGYGSYIPTVYSLDNITAYALNMLVSELNAIP